MTSVPPKVAPHDADAERVVLAALMLRPESIFELRAKLVTEDFFTYATQLVWEAIGRQHEARKPHDFVALVGVMRDTGDLEKIGGAEFISDIVNNYGISVSNVAYFADRMRDMADRRRLLIFASRVSDIAYNGDGQNLQGEVAVEATALLRRSESKSRKFSAVVASAQDTAARNRKARAEGKSLGAMTGIQRFDQLTGGFGGPRLVVVAARPKCGKSALLNQFGIHAASTGFPGYINTIELQDEELGMRGLASVSGQNITRLHRGYQDAHDRAADEFNKLGDLPLWIDDATRSLEGFCAQAAYHVHRHGVRWVAVDHIGLMRTNKRFSNRNDQMGEISWTLKELAKSLGIPVIALSQLSRLCDKENRRPRPDDLRDSGNLEQDADMVVMLHVAQSKRDEAQRQLFLGVPANRTGPSCWLKEEFVFDGPKQQIYEAQMPDVPPHYTDQE